MAILGWGFLLPVGAILARYLRHKDPLWYYLHIGLQFTGFIFGLAAVILGIQLYNRIHPNIPAHRGIGIFLLVLSILQVWDSRLGIKARVFKFWLNIYGILFCRFWLSLHDRRKRQRWGDIGTGIIIGLGESLCSLEQWTLFLEFEWPIMEEMDGKLDMDLFWQWHYLLLLFLKYSGFVDPLVQHLLTPLPHLRHIQVLLVFDSRSSVFVIHLLLVHI